MNGIQGVLAAIQADPSKAVEALRAGFEADFEGFLVELAGFVVSALEGAVPDP